MGISGSARVIIVGGSVAGLTLANTLEQVGIDYILLEKYGHIAPNLGASIATFPNGARILDQLGAYDSIASLLTDDKLQHMLSRDPSGKKCGGIPNAQDMFIERFGYEFIFLERKQLLEKLYNNIKDKSRILINKEVISIEHTEDGVNVAAKDGSCYHGELVIGADGVHSKVRRLMWEIADAKAPGLIPATDRKVPIPYRCIFGISPAPPGMDVQDSNQCIGHNYSFLIAGGPGRLIYWFLFVRNPNPNALYETPPRYSEDEMLALGEAYCHCPITESITFRALWESRTAATLTSLPEFVYTQWHFGRIMTIGDAAHKFNPIGGQGGNNAIEDCAVLVNNLHRTLQARQSLKDSPLTDSEVESVFATTQSARRDRTVNVMKAGHFLQSMQAQDSLMGRIFSLLGRYVMGHEEMIRQLSEVCLDAPRIEPLPLANRPHTVLFYDERPKTAAPSRTAFTVLAPVVVAGIVALAARASGVQWDGWSKLPFLINAATK